MEQFVSLKLEKGPKPLYLSQNDKPGSVPPMAFDHWCDYHLSALVIANKV
jgi:hypothetical protein